MSLINDSEIRRSGPPSDTILTLLNIVRLSVQYKLEVIPVAARELDCKWMVKAGAIPDKELRTQALASITSKRFHAEGGCTLAVVGYGVSRNLVALIVAIQTISDYLDNLTDRSGEGDPADFRLLHEAYLDAFESDGRCHDYYALRSQSEDGGYLLALVRECQMRTRLLPSYHVVAGRIRRLAKLYTDLQVYKHQLPLSTREPALKEWFQREWGRDDLYWWEFAAACGSTLGIFALLRAASNPNLTDAEAEAILEAYFPSICATHILLDYFIDQAEDVAGGDLNLVSYYSTEKERIERLSLLLRLALRRAAILAEARFHNWVVCGLPAMYLTDNKVREQRLGKLSKRLMIETGRSGHALQLMVKLHRLIP